MFIIAYIKHNKEAINWETTVAIPTPITPKLNLITKIKSKEILIIQAKIKNKSGVFESPNALNIDDNKWKNPIGINPIEVVFRYKTAKGKVSLGVFKISSI